jgi:hypothetical protein
MRGIILRCNNYTNLEHLYNYNMQLTLENIVVGMCMIGYILVGSSFLYKGNIPWAITWLSYGMANVGLIWAQSQS